MTAIARRTALAAAAALALAACSNTTPGGSAAGGGGSGEYAEDMTMGSPTAPVTLVEYASVTCPHCARFNANVFPAFKAKYIDTGKVYYVFREYPVHPQLDGPGYLLARCAGKDKYFKVVDALLRGVPLTEEDNKTWDYRANLMTVAKSVGLSEQQAMNCMQDADQAKKMNDRVEREAKPYNVESTPTFVLNGKKLEEQTEVDLPALDKAVQPLLAKKG